MRVAALTAGRALLLAGPTALAFFSGGYFDEPRAWAGLGAWVLVVVGLLAAPRPLPRSRAAWLAIAGLALYSAWTLLSIIWAPIHGSAYHAGQIAFLYLGALLAATFLLRSREAGRMVEPALAAGALIVIGYGLSERLLPGLLHFSRSVSAQGRLDQPLTYWNAMGELAALGFVLCARLTGDANRPARVRGLAAAAAAPLGMGVYLSFSRGALFACCAGLVVLIVLAPRKEQLRGIVVSLAAGILASAAAAPFRGVTKLAGALSTRELQGAITLALLLLIGGAAFAAQWIGSRRERPQGLRLPRYSARIAVAVICAGLGVAIVAGAKEKASRPLSAGASRYVTLQSNRYDYWRVAMRAFADHPIRGAGAGAWAVYWLKYRHVNEFAQDAHSLPLQTMAELGLVGLALLAAFLAGLAWAARRAHRFAPMLVAGPIAGFVAYIAHAPLDWDWQMPAVTLVAMVLAGAVLALEPEPVASDGDGRVLAWERRAAEEPALDREAGPLHRRV